MYDLLLNYCVFFENIDDHSRVKLHVDDESSSDYINANYIDVRIHSVIRIQMLGFTYTRYKISYIILGWWS